jgi:hypothetical protein
MVSRLGSAFPAVLALLCSASLARAADDFAWRGRVGGGQTIEIKGVNGAIRAARASGADVEVTAVKRAHKSDPATVTFDVKQHADGVTVCAMYPSPDTGRPNECAPGDGGRMNTRNNDVEVEFTVLVPAGVRLAARTVNGSVEAVSLQSDVEARTVNGQIELRTSGKARAKTVNGSINARLGSSTGEDALEFETVNGSITVALPAASDADFEARTVNGEISSDLPLTVRGRFTRQELSGALGRGGRPLRMKTVNGSIRVQVSS